jgi:hypothetical protein
MLGFFRLGFFFFNFMFSYFNININVGAEKIQTVPAFPEKVVQFGKIMWIYLKVGRFSG